MPGNNTKAPAIRGNSVDEANDQKAPPSTARNLKGKKNNMKTAEELNNISTIEEIHGLHLFDIAPHAHIITGANGKCMCGVYSGHALDCEQILAMFSHEMQSSMHANSLNRLVKGEKP